MYEMDARHRTIGDQRFTVIGPCPGCDAWQLEYAENVAAEFIGYQLGAAGLEPDMTAWYAVLEQALWDHADECVRLADIAQELGVRRAPDAHGGSPGPSL